MKMNNILKKLISFLCVIFCLISFQGKAKTIANATNIAISKGEVVMEIMSNRILYQNNGDKQLENASTTKILTAIIVIEKLPLDKKITVTNKTVGIEGSSIYLREGEVLTVLELLYGLMLRSGNDCAESLAIAVSGSIKAFGELMNSEAKRMGATNSNFVNPHGLPNVNHFTTAKDLAYISAYAMRNQIFKDIVSTKKVNISNGDMGYDRVLINKNKMLYDSEYATGVKTGYTKKAGRCLVSSYNKNGMEVVAVVLDSPNMYERSAQLLEQSFMEYENVKILDSKTIWQIPIENTERKIDVFLNDDVYYPLTQKELKNIEINVKLPKVLKIPFKKSKEIGKVEISCSKQLIYSEKIYTLVGVENLEYLEALKLVVGKWINWRGIQ